MWKSKLTDSQIMGELMIFEAGFAVKDICRELGIRTASFYKCRAKYGGTDVSMNSRIKELEEKNVVAKRCTLRTSSRRELCGGLNGAAAYRPGVIDGLYG